MTKTESASLSWAFMGACQGMVTQQCNTTSSWAAGDDRGASQAGRKDHRCGGGVTQVSGLEVSAQDYSHRHKIWNTNTGDPCVLQDYPFFG